MGGKIAPNHGVVRQGIFDQPVKSVVVVERLALHLIETDDLFSSASQAIIKIPLQAYPVIGQVKAFDLGWLFEQIEPGHGDATDLGRGARVFAPTALDRPQGFRRADRIGFVEAFDPVRPCDTTLRPPVVVFV
ncbi:hypothetical protein D3C84_304990 [compost metagenome]